MFQFRRFPAYAYLIQRMLSRYCRDGFPHSEIHGSKLMCSSPWLIAACHVLHRLLMPRHSPCALYSLIYYSCSRIMQALISDQILEIAVVTLFSLAFAILILVSTIYFLLCLSVALQICFLCSVFKVQAEFTPSCTLKIKHCKTQPQRSDLRDSAALSSRRMFSLERR